MSDKKTSLIDMAFALGLIAFLFISYGFDRASYSIGKYATSHDIKIFPFGWLIPFIYPTITLLISMTAFSVFWVMANKFRPQKWVKILCLVVGLIVSSAYSLSRMFRSPTSPPNLLEKTFWPLSYLHIAGSLITIALIFVLTLPKNKGVTKRNTLVFDIFSLVGLPIFLYICHILDTIIFKIPSLFARYKILFWYYPIALFSTEASIMYLFWLFQHEPYSRKWKKVLFLIIGLLVTYIYSILSIKAIQSLMPAYLFGGQIPAIILLQDIFWPNYYVHIAGTLIASTGLLLLFLPKKESTELLL